MEQDHMKRIVINPKVLVGKPVIKGTRVPVYEIVIRVAQGWTFKEIIEDFPRITEEDIKAALAYAGSLVEGEDVFPTVEKREHAVSG
jgi:uncharacterized protein (DUF433 family)